MSETANSCRRCGGPSTNTMEEDGTNSCDKCLIEVAEEHGCKVWELVEYLHLHGRKSENGTSTKSRKVYWKTKTLRDSILTALGDAEPPVTVRQLFYLVEARHGCTKDDAGYRRVQRQVLAMRREKLIDYDDIADNTRWRIKSDSYDGLEDFFEKSRRFYRQDLWARSDAYVEVWCEKDAIAGVLNSITHEYDVPLLPARGYSSETFAYESAEAMKASGKECHVYYCGDFDPSGWDASRDLERRLKDFFPEVTFTRLGVNFEDIETLRTRPSKTTDTRAKRFFQQFGAGCPSAELEAMHPDELRRRVREAIERHIDRDALEGLKLEETAAQETLSNFARREAQLREGT